MQEILSESGAREKAERGRRLWFGGLGHRDGYDIRPTVMSNQPRNDDLLRLRAVESKEEALLVTAQRYEKNAVEQELKLYETTTVIREEELSETNRIPDENDMPISCPDGEAGAAKRSRGVSKSAPTVRGVWQVLQAERFVSAAHENSQGRATVHLRHVRQEIADQVWAGAAQAYTFRQQAVCLRLAFRQKRYLYIHTKHRHNET